MAMPKLGTTAFALFSVACSSFNPPLRRLSPFLLPSVAVSRPFRFSVEI